MFITNQGKIILQIGEFFMTNWGKCYCKLGQLHSVTNWGKSYYKFGQLFLLKIGANVITNWGNLIIITSWSKFYYKSGQLTNQGNSYYKQGQLLQIGAIFITNWGITKASAQRICKISYEIQKHTYSAILSECCGLKITRNVNNILTLSSTFIEQIGNHYRTRK